MEEWKTPGIKRYSVCSRVPDWWDAVPPSWWCSRSWWPPDRCHNPSVRREWPTLGESPQPEGKTPTHSSHNSCYPPSGTKRNLLIRQRRDFCFNYLSPLAARQLCSCPVSAHSPLCIICLLSEPFEKFELWKTVFTFQKMEVRTYWSSCRILFQCPIDEKPCHANNAQAWCYNNTHTHADRTHTTVRKYRGCSRFLRWKATTSQAAALRGPSGLQRLCPSCTGTARTECDWTRRSRLRKRCSCIINCPRHLFCSLLQKKKNGPQCILG